MSRWIQTEALLPPLPRAKPCSIPVPAPGGTQPAVMGFFILSLFPPDAGSSPLCQLLEGGHLLSPVSPELTD